MKQELKTPPSFIIWEANPSFSREVVTAHADTERGDIIVRTTNGYEPYKGEKLDVAQSMAEHGCIYIALSNAKAGEKVSVIARGAVILYDKLNHTKADDKTNQKPILDFVMTGIAQQLVFRNSIAPDWSA